MDLQLHGKRALITGSSSGIGEGIAKALAQEGATVVIHGRNQAQINRVAQDISSSGGKAFIAVGGLSTDEETKDVVNQVLSSVDGVDILINNAGQYENSGWQDTPPDRWAEIYNTNVISALRMVQLLTPQMKQLGWGRIIQIACHTAFPCCASLLSYQSSLVEFHR